MLSNLVAIDCWIFVLVASLVFGCVNVVFRSNLCLGIWLVALVLLICCWVLVLLFGFVCVLLLL